MAAPPLILGPDADLAYAAAQCVVSTHQRLAAFLREGLTLAQIDQFVARQLEDLKCRSCFIGYKVGRSPAFPSHACLSVNDCVVHGTAGAYTKPLKEGDLVKIDIGVWYRGMVGDAAWTYAIKSADDLSRRLMESGKRSLIEGVKEFKPGAPLVNWAKTVQRIVESAPPKGFGFHLVRGLGGHGIGKGPKGLHLPPYVANVAPSMFNPSEWPDAGMKCVPGLLIAVEPMIGAGTAETYQNGNEWPVYIKDGSKSVHYEHDVLVTAEGPRVLTRELEGLPDIVG